MKRQYSSIVRGMGIALAWCLTVVLSSCASTPPSSPATSSSTATAKPVLGNVAIFTPSDGITLSQHTPLNKWAAFPPELEEALLSQGFSQNHITQESAKSLDKQSQQVQDYVVSHVATNAKGDTSAQATSLLVAPVVDTSSVSRQYGDYVSHPMRLTTDSDATSQSDSLDHSETSEDTRQKGSASKQSAAEQEVAAYQRLLKALELAQKNGMHVVLLSNDMRELTPNLLVTMSDPERIGQIQAQQLVNKLELDKASKDNPRYIEVLIPTDFPKSNDETASPLLADSTSAQEIFKGMWQVLSPYFQDGRAVSPSGLLNTTSNLDSWSAVAFDPGSDTSATVQELNKRLSYGSKSNKDDITRVDGIIASNDFIAAGVTTALGSLGYKGSSADINPEISIGSIVGNMTGKKDVQRRSVPRPRASQASPGSDSSNGSSNEGSSQGSSESDQQSAAAHWPIVTGYGSYIDNLPHVVDGQQWMTALEDRLGLAKELATICASFNQGQELKGQANIASRELQGRRIQNLVQPLTAVSASNLKSALIDPGYIRPADAGL
ncbi:hypothetical protein KIM372_09050 [Bombiscardovia nodaiensis]|uniref:Periplasmic binding protein domain-containing protein n=1 Tax=Bombiscardovia nodaiensis TaxID=2932181 RepID=A0ABM8B7Z2_9BIFI|nr:hypothetical protein KIM372_09050 [Bombiscardovia nodaiensis]